ncbi:hypothetical protein KAR91_51190 [Candidatus Pacearchaeota archaeon]|nr:hypothetical protein [Candidatus Pacearchaeota archaeon]
MRSLTLQELGFISTLGANSDTIPSDAKPFENEGEKLWVSPTHLPFLSESADVNDLDHLIVTDRLNLADVILFGTPEGSPRRGIYLDALQRTGQTHLLIPDFRKQCANLICIADLKRGEQDVLCLGDNGIIHYKHSKEGGQNEFHPLGKEGEVLALSPAQ